MSKKAYLHKIIVPFYQRQLFPLIASRVNLTINKQFCPQNHFFCFKADFEVVFSLTPENSNTLCDLKQFVRSDIVWSNRIEKTRYPNGKSTSCGMSPKISAKLQS